MTSITSEFFWNLKGSIENMVFLQIGFKITKKSKFPAFEHTALFEDFWSRKRQRLLLS